MDTPVIGSMDRHGTASTLLDHFSVSERSTLLNGLIASLHPADDTSINFVASLLEKLADRDTTQEFINFLDQAIRAGEVQCATTIYSRYPVVGKELMNRAVEFVSKAKSTATESQSDHGALPFYLRFLKLTVSHTWEVNTHQELLGACLSLLATAKEEISLSARDFVFALLSSPDQYIVSTVIWPSENQIWYTIKALVDLERNDLRITLGFSLWLRWILGKPTQKAALGTFAYWELLRRGLRTGDAERRKLCLSILRISTSYSEADPEAKAESQQYNRYCKLK